MKKTLNLLGFIALIAVIVITFASCKNEPDPTFQGTWTKDSFTLIFSGSNITIGLPAVTFRGTFASTANQLTFNFTDRTNDEGVTWEDVTHLSIELTPNYILTHSTLTLSGIDSPFDGYNGTWTK